MADSFFNLKTIKVVDEQARFKQAIADCAEDVNRLNAEREQERAKEKAKKGRQRNFQLKTIQGRMD